MSTPTATEHAAATPAKPGGKRDFLSLLDGARDQIAMVLPAHINVERVCRIARSAYLTNAKIQQCSPASILLAVARAAELGLEAGGARQLAHLVPFKGECTLILGVNGALELARRTGQYASIESRVVYEGEEFRVRHSSGGTTYEHDPDYSGERGAPRLVYAAAKLRNGESALEVMTATEVEEIRKRLPSFQADSPAWRNFWGEMARKVVLKRLLKRMPQSVELAEALDRDTEAEGWGGEARDERPAVAHRSKSAALAARLAPPPAPEAPADDTPQAEAVPAEDASQEPAYDESIHDTEGGRHG